MTVQIAAAGRHGVTLSSPNDTKPLPGQPALPLESKPGAQVVVPPPPPAPRLHAYLPLIHKR